MVQGLVEIREGQSWSRKRRHFEGVRGDLVDVQGGLVRLTGRLFQVGHEAMPGGLAVLFLLQDDLLELLREPREDRLKTAHQALEEVDPLAQGEVDVGLDRVLDRPD